MATEDHPKTLTAVPPWTASGVLPPVGGSSPADVDRSPYLVPLASYVQRFGGTPERQLLIDGLLRYRSALHAAGFNSGFQWLNGSFVEHIELIEGRPPNDIDVVTFSKIPKGKSEVDFVVLFDPDSTMPDYYVDSYFVNLDTNPEFLTELSAYWYSLLSHRRDERWKGFVQVDLTPTEGDILVPRKTRKNRKARKPRNKGRR